MLRIAFDGKPHARFARVHELNSSVGGYVVTVSAARPSRA